MKSRRSLTEAITVLRSTPVVDVPSTFELLRDDLAERLADLAAEVLLHQEASAEALDAFPEEFLDSSVGQELVSRVEPPLWELLANDFLRMAVWLPRQRLARFGEDDVLHLFRERIVVALRPALVELERNGVLTSESAVFSDGYWEAVSLYDLAVRYEGFTLALARAIHTRFRTDRSLIEAAKTAPPTEEVLHG